LAQSTLLGRHKDRSCAFMLKI